jgi:glycosyltransferase involved in cell wall biosynthesis
LDLSEEKEELKAMRILLVAMSTSIHVVHWIDQIADLNWDLHLFPSIDTGSVHPDLQEVTVYHSFYDKQPIQNGCFKVRGFPVVYKTVSYLARGYFRKYFPDYRVTQLKRLIKRLKPDIIHAIEIQAAGYLTLEAKKRFQGQFPPVIITNWGSDIYLFGRLAEHEPKIREVLALSDFYSCECQRDVSLALDFGFKGIVLPVFPNTGGFELEEISKLRETGAISDRRIIMLKGYQHWAGRAQVGLRALERCASLLRGYKVVIYSPSPDTIIAAELFSKSTGIPILIIPDKSSNKEILKHHGRSRISIGLSISDAISTSLLEAMVMGAFPIQSWTACANEWIEDGKSGLLVPPEDPEIIEQAIRRAITDDNLVNGAAEINYQIAKEKLDKKLIKPKIVELYKSVFRTISNN